MQASAYRVALQLSYYWARRSDCACYHGSWEALHMRRFLTDPA